jgi:hypothetical protein
MRQVNEGHQTAKASCAFGIRTALGAGMLSIALLAGAVGVAGAATSRPGISHTRTISMERESKDTSKETSKDSSSGGKEGTTRDSQKDAADRTHPTFDG